MAPKSKKSAAAADKQKDLQETEDPLQAVVLADSFETRFSPFTKEVPRCLLPLANTPLIEYTLEFLANSGVEEVYLYCGAHTEQVEAYIQKTKWTSPTATFTLTVLRSTSRTIGDAMRDLDKREILTNDFLIVYGDVVSNMSIAPALREHQARRATDKNAIMTMVLREGGQNAHRGAKTSPVFILDDGKKRCLQYEQISISRNRNESNDDEHTGHSLILDEDVFSLGADEIDIRHDLIDPGIDICTPDVLALWQDNFDYEAPRRGFLHSVLKDYELNGKTIHTYIEKEAYANRARDLKSYDRIAKDVLGRWTWPMCPDVAFADEGGCRMSRGYLREEGVTISKSAAIGKRALIGKGSSIGARTKIANSTVGRNCKIGVDCTIEGSYIWDGTEIGDNTHVRRAVVANNVAIGKNCNIAEGTLVAHGGQLADDSTTKPRQRLIRSSSKDAHSPAEPYEGTSDSETEENAYIPSSPRSLSRQLSADSISTLTSSRSTSPDPSPSKHHRTTSTTSSTSTHSHDTAHTRTTSIIASEGDAETVEDAATFHKEASTSITDALNSSDDVANIQIELQGLRMASNASEHAVRKAVVAGLVGHLVAPEGRRKKVADVIKANTELVRRVVFDLEADEKTDQVDLLICVQRELEVHVRKKKAEEKEAQTMLLNVVYALYSEDLVQGAGVVQWWEDKKGTETEGMRSLRGHKDLGKLIDIARNEEESESEEESEEDESD